MGRVGLLGVACACFAAVAFAPATAAAETVCGTVEEFNAAMAADATQTDDVTLTYDLVGVNPSDFAESKGSIAQMRNTACATGQDAVIKVYGTSEPLNESHPPGTLKMEHGNSCCPGDCGEQWADPNASAVIFVDGTETCHVTMWIKPDSVGYTLECSNGTFDALGENPLGNLVDRIAVLEYILEDGGTTWEMPNATATNDEVCWVSMPSDMESVTVPVLEDVTVGPSWANTVFPDVGDLAVEADGTAAYLKFEVPEIQGKITQARLFMHTSTAPSSDGDGGEVHAVMDSMWSEDTLTYGARPMVDAASLGRMGPGAADTPLSLELGTAVSSPGTYTFAVVSPPTDGNGTHFWSKEGSASAAAYLKIDYEVMDGDGDGTPNGPDCDDADPAIGPGAEELCNGVDDNCDGDTDEGCEGVDSTGGSDGDGDSGAAVDESDSGGSEAGGLGGSGFDGRGGDSSCACTTTRRTSPAWLGLVAIALGFVRRRRR
jgi:MYXO-CTERM domain-containing protein